MEKNKNKIATTIGIGLLILAVIGGMLWFTKPWERYWAWQDEQKIEKAGWLGNKLSTYYKKADSWPWNFAVRTYAPAEYQRRGEAPFVYQAQKGDNRDWWWAFFEVEGVDKKEVQYWQENDSYWVVKQVSAGSRVAVCFKPKSAKYQAVATEACREDGLGRRNTLSEVDGYDLCHDNLLCEIQEL